MATLTLQPNSSSGNDIYLDSSAPTTNLNGGGFCMGEINVGSAKARGLIKFDISSIPAGSTITSVILYLTVTARYSSNTRTYRFYRCLRNWIHSQATYNNFSNGNAWAVPGCGDSSADYDGSVQHGSKSLSASEAVDSQVAISMSTDEFSKWVDGVYPNYGWMGKADVEDDDFYSFYDCEEGTASKRPKLVVEYTEPMGSGNFFAVL